MSSGITALLRTLDGRIPDEETERSGRGAAQMRMAHLVVARPAGRPAPQENQRDIIDYILYAYTHTRLQGD